MVQALRNVAEANSDIPLMAAQEIARGLLKSLEQPEKPGL